MRCRSTCSKRSLLKRGIEPPRRARLVRLVADDPQFSQAEYNNAFVLMQYFGYLRRNPDQNGYLFWLNILNQQLPNNYRAMVCAFTTLEFKL
jgi:hypothetical protein